MRPFLTKAAWRGVAVVSIAIGALSGLVLSAVRSDFVSRDCHNIPSAEWQYTANCTDAYGAIVVTGSVVLACLALAFWSMWRPWHG